MGFELCWCPKNKVPLLEFNSNQRDLNLFSATVTPSCSCNTSAALFKVIPKWFKQKYSCWSKYSQFQLPKQLGGITGNEKWQFHNKNYFGINWNGIWCAGTYILRVIHNSTYDEKTPFDTYLFMMNFYRINMRNQMHTAA